MTTQTSKSDAGMIYEVVPAIMSEIPTIGKDRKNAAQNYQFRGIDDVYNTVNPIMAKHGVFMRAEVQDVKREERPSKSGGTMAFVQVKVRYFFVAKDGSSVFTDSLGEGMDSGDKATPKAMSIAQKYAILQMFCIPTLDAKDPEEDNPEPAPVAKLKAAFPAAQKPTAAPKTPPAVVHAPKPVKDEWTEIPPEDDLDPRLNVEPHICSKDQLAIFAEAKIAMSEVGIDEEKMWQGIHRYSQKTFSRTVTDAGDFTADQMDEVLGYLRRWHGARESEIAKGKPA